MKSAWLEDIEKFFNSTTHLDTGRHIDMGVNHLAINVPMTPYNGMSSILVYRPHSFH